MRVGGHGVRREEEEGVVISQDMGRLNWCHDDGIAPIRKVD